jgi:hypothetical protein
MTIEGRRRPADGENQLTAGSGRFGRNSEDRQNQQRSNGKQ